MKQLTPVDRELIIEALKSGNSFEGLANLVNLIIKIQNEKLGTNYKLVSGKRIAYYVFHRDDMYYSFEIPKKTGGVRKINAPDQFLKKVLRRVDLALEILYEPKVQTHGFVNNRSIVSNAKPHVGKKYVYNVDLKDFFPSISYHRIKAVLKIPPYELRPFFAHLISHLSCYGGVLPQGAPTSPLITNIISRRLDDKLMQLAEEYNCTHTRYADDITFSSDQNCFNQDFLFSLYEVVASEGFVLNDKKTRLQKYFQRQEVTGLVVNEKLNVNRKFIKEIRAMLYNWEKYGLEHCQELLISKYLGIKNSSSAKLATYEKVLLGKIHFLGMVRGKEDEYYQAFIAKYKNLNY